MNETERTEDSLVFSDGDKAIRFKRLAGGVAMSIENIRPEDVVLSIENFVSYIAWEHYVDMSDVEHGQGQHPDITRDNWNKLIED